MSERTIDIGGAYVSNDSPLGYAVPTFKNGALRMLSLDRVLAYRGTVSDVNEVSGIGIFVPTKDCINGPKSPNTSDIIVSLVPNGSYGIILYLCQSGGGLFWRNQIGPETRGQWYKVASEKVV